MEFSRKRIETNEEKFHDKMSKLKPKTFSSLCAKKVVLKQDGKEIGRAHV